jgi:hypothetical protein
VSAMLLALAVTATAHAQDTVLTHPVQCHCDGWTTVTDANGNAHQMCVHQACS